MFVDGSISLLTKKRIASFVKERGGFVEEFLDKDLDVIVLPNEMPNTVEKKNISTKYPSRSALLCNKAQQSHKKSPSNVGFSKKWDIATVTINQLFKKGQVRKLKAPFIKVEDRSRRFRPEYLEMTEIPKIDFTTPLGTCPFPPYQLPRHQQMQSKSMVGYCECCNVAYSNLDKHLQSQVHQEVCTKC